LIAGEWIFHILLVINVSTFLPSLSCCNGLHNEAIKINQNFAFYFRKYSIG
jgi:hypothetical protein